MKSNSWKKRVKFYNNDMKYSFFVRYAFYGTFGRYHYDEKLNDYVKSHYIKVKNRKK